MIKCVPGDSDERSDVRIFRFVKDYGFLILSFVPFAVLCFFVALKGVNVPYWDEWEFSRLLGRWYNGRLCALDFWAQHNEHRMIFSRLLMLCLALCTGWNIYYELALSLMFGAGIYALLVLRVLEMGAFTSIGRRGMYFVLSVLVFSLAQAESWLLGEQNQIFMNVLAAVAGIFLLTGHPLNPGKFFMALLCGVVATYSMACGILLWPLGFVIILIRPLFFRSKLVMLSAWMFAAILVSMSYLYRYYHPPHHPSLYFVLAHPVEAFRYFFAYLGFPLSAGTADGAVWAGGTGFLLFGMLSLYGFRRLRGSGKKSLSLLYWLGLGIYSLGCAALTTAARAQWGVSQALALRYVPFSNLLWISSAVLMSFFVLDAMPSFHPRMKRILRSKIFQSAVLILFLSLTTGAAKVGWFWGQMHSDLRSLARNYLLAGYYDDYYFKRFLYPADLHRKLKVMKKHQLSCFNRNAGSPVPLRGPMPVKDLLQETNDATYFLDEFVDQPQSLFLRGWAVINGEDSKDAIAEIVLQSAAGTYALEAIRHRRLDVTDWFHRIADYDDSGFIANIPKIHLPKGEYRIGLFIRKGKIRSLTYTPRRISI